MTSFRQIEANRCNAAKSTGPNTEESKHRSRRNAVRHGLSAETVVEIIEDIEDYLGFEAAIIADYDARTAVERELVLRLASPLRRATTIETDLLRIQTGILRDRRHGRFPDWSNDSACPIIEIIPSNGANRNANNDEKWQIDRLACCGTSPPATRPINLARQLTLRFQRIANLDNGVFEWLGRYESAIARHLKTLHLLQSVRAR